MIILNLKQVVAEYKSDKIDFNDRDDQYIMEPLTKLDFYIHSTRLKWVSP